MTKELHLTKSLWRDLYASSVISDASRILELIDRPAAAKWPLWIAFITTYCRPFTANNDMGMISEKVIPREFRALHTSFMMARNLLYGHTNPLETLDDGNEANQIFLRKKGEAFDVLTITLCPSDSEIPNTRKLISLVHAELNKRTDIGRQAISRSLAGKPDGDYKFHYPKKKSA